MAQEGRLPRGSITLYWSELWSITKTELLMMERVHSKILCTIQGLPTRCPFLLCVISLVLAASPPSSHRQLAFVNSITIMDSSALRRRLPEHRVSCNPTSGCIPVCNPDLFFNLIFGVEWLSDTDAAIFLTF